MTCTCRNGAILNALKNDKTAYLNTTIPAPDPNLLSEWKDSIHLFEVQGLTSCTSAVGWHQIGDYVEEED